MNEVQSYQPNLLDTELHQHGEMAAGNVSQPSQAEVLGVGGIHLDTSLKGSEREQNRLEERNFNVQTDWIIRHYLQDGGFYY